ncbi:MAG: bifunctional ADP-dependent NAD(P)H-hydrate dehydratase/NAD(P)H-hydrate epimerase, partial [Rhodospirillaceae bacterium]|nr:bifunctional ADP-dependent NAD(P)H-hydrate dehydratase/NAD(P)H-hydrate epimerase [Rhodospirillaceae bacterium]
MTDARLLMISEMTAADAATIAAGTPERELMEAAGGAVAREILKRWQPRPTVVLVGPGNNGGDGLIVTRLLSEAGWTVKTAYLKDLSMGVLDGDTLGSSVDDLLVVDALFGAGLTRPVEGVAADIFDAINERGLDCVAVDMPSGIDGDSGAIRGVAPKAQLTVTFFRRKPGHLLLPGRDLCGEVIVADIGIPDLVLDDINPNTFANGPDLWRQRFPRRQATDHKYTHGHAVVVGGGEMTGAARLAATAARRIGAGLVSLAVPPAAFDSYAAGEPGNIVKNVADTNALADLFVDERKNAVLVGPGCGVDGRTRDFTCAALASGRAVVIDADALT